MGLGLKATAHVVYADIVSADVQDEETIKWNRSEHVQTAEVILLHLLSGLAQR